MSVHLAIAGVEVPGTLVTINVADLPVASTADLNGGWHDFVFASPVLLVGATVYTVETKTSSTGQVSLFSTATTNWARALVTTTTQAPVAGDDFIVAGEYTGAGTSNSFAVNMNETAATDYGAASTSLVLPSLAICSKGTLTYDVTPAFTRYLRQSGNVIVYSGGTLNIGTSGAPMPATSTGILEFDCGANVDFGLIVRPLGNCNKHGYAKWPAVALTGASNATPIEITSTSHGLSAGERITIASVGGNTAANGTWEVIASTGANTFTIGAINGAVGGLVGTSTGNGAYTSGGTWQRLAYTRMTANAAAAATVITVLSTAGMAAGDEVCFPSTSRTNTESEKRTILTVDSPTQFTITAGLTNAHSGTTPTQCEVGVLTRNVKIRGMSVTLQSYVHYQTTSIVTCSNVEFYWLGSATTSKRGIDISTTTGSCLLSYCSLHDFVVASSSGITVSFSTSSNITLANSVLYNLHSFHWTNGVTSGTWTADANLSVLNVSGNMWSFGDIGGTFTNNTVAGAAGRGVNISEVEALGTFKGNTVHAAATGGVIISSNLLSGTIDNLLAWRNASSALLTLGSGFFTQLVIKNITAFGNAGGISLSGGAGNILFTTPTLSGDTTFSTPYGFTANTANICADIIIEDGNFGSVAGIMTAHTTGDIGIQATWYLTLTTRNTILASATQVSGQTSLQPGAYVRNQRLGGTAGNHKTFTCYGTISVDTTIFDVSPQSARMTPNNASFKLASDGNSVDGKGAFRVPVVNAGTVTVSVRVRESVVGDGTDYNGNRIRLILRKNVAAGIPADVVLATATGSSVGAWETIQGTTAAVTDNAVLSFVVDCDGTTGWINADTFVAA